MAVNHEPKDTRRILIDGMEVQEQISLCVLGTVLEGCKNPAGPAVRHRLGKAWNAWFAMCTLFCFHEGSILQRLRLFHLTATSTVLWGLECVGTRESDHVVLKVSYLTMLSRMLWVGRRAGVTWVSISPEIVGRHGPATKNPDMGCWGRWP